MIPYNLPYDFVNVRLYFFKRHRLVIKNCIVADAADKFNNRKDHNFRIFECMLGLAQKIVKNKIDIFFGIV